jgi:hypothetical protein
MFPEIAHEELSATLDRVSLEALADAGTSGPPVNAFAVARALGLVVAWDDRQTSRARFVRLGRNVGADTAGGSIMLRHDPRAERRQWAVAHEIGEHLAQRVFSALGVSAPAAPPNAREQVANLLAARLLLPRPWFSEDGERLAWDLPALKQRYTSASHEMIARRMLDMSPPVIVSIFDHDRLTFRRSNLPGRAPAISAEEAECRAAAHRSGESACGEMGLDTIQAWPVHEPDWKREIVRTTAEASCVAW